MNLPNLKKTTESGTWMKLHFLGTGFGGSAAAAFGGQDCGIFHLSWATENGPASRRNTF